MMTGRPMAANASCASFREPTNALFGLSRPIRAIASRNCSRSSALAMASRLAPISSTPWRSRAPLSASASAVLSAVWPPMVGKSASGFSLSRMRSTISGVIGST